MSTPACLLLYLGGTGTDFFGFGSFTGVCGQGTYLNIRRNRLCDDIEILPSALARRSLGFSSGSAAELNPRRESDSNRGGWRGTDQMFEGDVF